MPAAASLAVCLRVNGLTCPQISRSCHQPLVQVPAGPSWWLTCPLGATRFPPSKQCAAQSGCSRRPTWTPSKWKVGAGGGGGGRGGGLACAFLVVCVAFGQLLLTQRSQAAQGGQHGRRQDGRLGDGSQLGAFLVVRVLPLGSCCWLTRPICSQSWRRVGNLSLCRPGGTSAAFGQLLPARVANMEVLKQQPLPPFSTLGPVHIALQLVQSDPRRCRWRPCENGLCQGSGGRGGWRSWAT